MCPAPAGEKGVYATLEEAFFSLESSRKPYKAGILTIFGAGLCRPRTFSSCELEQKPRSWEPLLQTRLVCHCIGKLGYWQVLQLVQPVVEQHIAQSLLCLDAELTLLGLAVNVK